MTDALFSGDIQALSVSEIRSVFANSFTHDVNEDKTLVDLLVDTKILPSKREARQMIQDGAIRVNGEVVKDLEFVVTKKDALDQELTVIRRGKKHYHLINHGE